VRAQAEGTGASGLTPGPINGISNVTGPTAHLPAPSPETLYRLAAEQYEHIDSYIARLRRREQVNGTNKPEEILLFKFRKQPWSVYFKWLGSQGNGREVVYVKGQHGDQMHTLLAAGDIPFMPAGKRMALSPDSSLVRSASRHSLSEAGIGYIVQQFGEHVRAAATPGGPSFGTLKCLGYSSRQEYPAPLEYVEQVIHPRQEPLLPRGGRRIFGFDPTSHLPVLVITSDDAGNEAEFYGYDRIQYPVHLDDDDFNPEKLWAPKK
jgi:hypothetical protein